MHPYRSRLWPSPWVWVLVVAMCGLLATAYGAAYGLLPGCGVFVVATVLALGLLVRTSPVIEVGAGFLRAGPARISLDLLAHPRTMEAADITAILRSGDARVYTLLRPWSSARGLRVDVTDPDDPHRSWLLTTGDPDGLLAALTAAGVDPVR